MAKKPKKRKGKRRSSSYNRYSKKLERDVADGYTPLFRWYRRVGTAHVEGRLTKKEFKKLLNKGKDYEV